MKFFILPLCACVFFGAGCWSRGTSISTTSSTKNSLPTVSYFQLLVFRTKTSNFFAPAPYDQNFKESDYSLSVPDESWTPDGMHRVFIKFVRNGLEGVEGIALRVQNISTGSETEHPLINGETLTSALEDEAGWPVLDISYDKKNHAIVYSVYNETHPAPYLTTSGAVLPKPRTLVGKQTIKL